MSLRSMLLRAFVHPAHRYRTQSGAAGSASAAPAEDASPTTPAPVSAPPPLPAAAGGGESLEDLLGLLRSQIQGSDWLDKQPRLGRLWDDDGNVLVPPGPAPAAAAAGEGASGPGEGGVGGGSGGGGAAAATAPMAASAVLASTVGEPK